MCHIGENAELYALGALDEKKRMQTEDHARYCIPCMMLLGDAERIVSDLEFAMPPLDPPPRLEERLLRSARAPETRKQNRPMRHWRALTTLILLGILSTLMGLRLAQTDRQLRENNAIVAVLAGGEFGHVSLRARATDKPIAKAICEKDGKWIYLLVEKANPNLTLYGERDGNRQKLGRPVSQGEAATLFVERPGKFSTLELVANGQIVATAKTAYPR